MFVWIAFFENNGNETMPFYASTKEKAIRQLLDTLKLSYEAIDFGHEDFESINNTLLEEKWVISGGYKLYVKNVEYE